MKFLLIISCIFIVASVSAQHQIFLQRTDMYYDSTLYKSIRRGASIIKEKDTIFEGKKEPYSLFLERDTVFIRFKYSYNGYDTILPYYPTKKGDTIKSLFSKSYLNYKSKSKWISQEGRNSFICDTVINIGATTYECYLIKFEESSMAADKHSDVTKLIYVDKSSLVAIKTVKKYFKTQTLFAQPYYSVTYIDSISNTDIPDNLPKEHLIWEDTSTVWNNEQKIRFKKSCLKWTDQVTCDCIINELSSTTNYFKLQMPHVNSSEKYRYWKSIEHCENE